MNNEVFFLLSECHDARINGQPPPQIDAKYHCFLAFVKKPNKFGFSTHLIYLCKQIL